MWRSPAPALAITLPPTRRLASLRINGGNGASSNSGGVYKYSADATINGAATVTNSNPDNCSGNGYTC